MALRHPRAAEAGAIGGRRNECLAYGRVPAMT